MIKRKYIKNMATILLILFIGVGIFCNNVPIRETTQENTQLETKATFSGLSVGDEWSYWMGAVWYCYEITSITASEVYADFFDNGVLLMSNYAIWMLYVIDDATITSYIITYGSYSASYGGQSLTVTDDGTYIWDTATGIMVEHKGFYTLDLWYVVAPQELPAAPDLDPISPNVTTTGTINLDWNSVPNATKYHVYRNISTITTVTGLTPIASPTISQCMDNISVNGDYYYVVVPEDRFGRNGSMSNCVNVTVAISTGDNGIPGFESILILLSLFTLVFIYSTRKRLKI